MSHQYYNDPYGSPRYRTTNQSYQPSNSSSRRNIPPTSSNFAYQSTFQPTRERNPTSSSSYPRYQEEYSYSNEYPNSTNSSSNRINNSSNERSHRRYQLEQPSTHSHARHSQLYNDNQQDLPRSSDRQYMKNQQPSTNHSQATRSYYYDQDTPRYVRNSDRRHYQEETYPSQSYPVHSNRRSVDIPSVRQHSNSIRSFDQPSSNSQHTLPIHRSSHHSMVPRSQRPMPVQLPHPASLLNHFLQSFFGGHSPSFNDDDDDDDRSSAGPIDLIAFALMMPRPDAPGIPAAIHIQFGDLFDLLAQDEPPSVGLSDSDIERIPKLTYRKSSKSKGTDDKCAVCLSEYKNGETVKRLQCKHYFHPECIDPWLKTSTKCPICRGTQTD